MNDYWDNRRGSSGKLYYCKIWKGGSLVRDYIPVRVGQVGYMYDKVSGQLFGNSGTGDFVLGPDKILPEGYTRLDYIENNSSAFINLGINTSPLHRIDMEIYATSGQDNCIWGSGGAAYKWMLWSVRTPSNGLNLVLPSATYKLADRDALFHRYIIDFPQCYAQFDNESPIAIADMSTASNSYAQYLFAYSQLGTRNNTYRFLGGCRHYSISVNGELICDMYPCVSPTNVVGMYDVVRKDFFGSGNSDTFIAHYL